MMLPRLLLLACALGVAEGFVVHTAPRNVLRAPRPVPLPVRCEAAGLPNDDGAEAEVIVPEAETFVSAPVGAGGAEPGTDVWATSKPLIIFSVMTGLFFIGKFFN